MIYEACFDCGDDDRLPSWDVVEWTHVTTSAKAGTVVARYYGDEIGAREHASILNTAAAVDAFETQECEFDR